jgi:uncharacterized membrane-anchored protein YjiN (DUF445 family)
MKRTATLLLVASAAVFVVSTVVPGLGVTGGFVQAGAEAAMVGGLADWFAVTALFRRPLGLPIPHTALIPRKKDELATKLGEFVTGYFLTPEVLSDQVVEAGLVGRVGSWLADPQHASVLAVEAAAAAVAAVDVVDPDVVAAELLDVLAHDTTRHSPATALGNLLATAVDAGAPRPLVALLVSHARRYLEAHQAELAPTVKRFIEERHWVAWVVTTDRTVAKLFRDAIRELEVIERSPTHPLHAALDGLLTSVAVDLRQDPATRARVDGLVADLLADPRTSRALSSVVADALASLRRDLADPDGALVGRIAELIGRLGERVVGEEGFHRQVEQWVQAMVGHAVGRYGHELTEIIRRQVGAWSGQSASQRIELAVGRDLQFIRLNGTAVGALAGLAIHAVALAIA